MTPSTSQPDRVARRRFALPRFAYLLTVGAVAAMAALSGCGPQRAVLLTEEPTQLQANTFARQWVEDLQLKNDEIVQLYLRGDYLICYTRKGMSYIVDRGSGSLKAESLIPDDIHNVRPPVVLKDYVVYPTAAKLFVFDKNGRQKGTLELEYPLRSAAVGEGNLIFYGADSENGGRVVCLDVSKQNGSGIPRWSYLTYGVIEGSPAIFQALLYTGSEDGTVACVNADTGASIWPLPHSGRFQTRDSIVADIRADDYGVYVASTDTNLYCLKKTEGKIVWEYYSGVPLKKAPWVSPTSVYQPMGHDLACLNKIVEGSYVRKPAWTAPNVLSYLAEDDKNTYVEDTNHTIVALDHKTGQAVFRSKATGFALFVANTDRLNAKGGIVYAATRDGLIVAVNPVLKPGTSGFELRSADKQERAKLREEEKTQSTGSGAESTK